ncbi:hypothetical protein [Pseudomonas typographi]|uniref:Peptidase M10 serralysin C-terminal domain-containing protein n=2 Tax=Pseudomonas typographi TaxID=2715964 RepID=A0ABR7Z8F4_9PSED|nr:hypothetical protein [Pseudomonas typographi]MBD1554565.1 hypothetical protein [Pseudomonas typographi]MBD1601598.1 hypothetical protein [Pseudomonas typographi]
MSSTDGTITAISSEIVIKGRGVYTAYEGTRASDDLAVGGAAALYLEGGGGADTLVASSNDDVLIGGAGVNTLTGGASRDNFVFTHFSDSYGNAEGSHSDLITDWNAEGRLDLTALGLSLDDLTVSYDAAADITYVRATQANSAGNDFEVRLQGASSQALTSENFIARVDGTASNDVIDLNPSEQSYVINWRGSCKSFPAPAMA